MIRVGESGYLLELAREGAPIAAFARLSRDSPAGVVDLVPGARTLLVVCAEPLPPAAEERLRTLEQSCVTADHIGDAPSRRHEIRVRYDGPDLADVASHAGLSVAATIELHASAEYRVAFLGFQPGFAYLAGLDESLATPRRASPRPRVPLGSVAIGGEWTGIYPFASPGGWNLIGTTEVALFSAGERPPARLTIGDRVRFVPQ
jgi:KipI family sensor histidine kinase inhibitor